MKMSWTSMIGDGWTDHPWIVPYTGRFERLWIRRQLKKKMNLMSVGSSREDAGWAEGS